MKTIFFAAIMLVVCLGACNFLGDRITGNGKASSEVRHVNDASKISVVGSVDVVVEQGATASLKVEADENIIPYIETHEDNGRLEITTKNNTSLSSKNPIRVVVTTPSITALEIKGSGEIVCNNSFASANKISLRITGSGNITADVSAPGVDADIKGSGNIQLRGETKDVEVDIKGSGNYEGAALKAENAVIEIAGSGDATVFADMKLDAKVRGSGTIKYRGNAVVNKSVSGSGDIIKVH